MLPNFAINETEILAFALVLLRVSAFIIVWPVFSVYNVPNTLKILFAVSVSSLIFPVINRSGLNAQDLDQWIAWLTVKEVLTGLCLGFMTRLFFFALNIGGNLIATSAGLVNAQLFNPAFGAATSTVEQFYAVIGTLLFLAMDGHHYFLIGLVQSFDAIPLITERMSNGTGIASSVSQMDVIIGRFGESGLILQSVTEAGIKMAAPVMIAIFMANLVMGIVSRAVPQINVLVVSMNVNFVLALLVMMISIPALIFQLDHDIVAFTDMMFRFMKSN